MASFIGGIVQITIGAIVLGSVFISAVHSQNTSGWTTGETALWGVLALVGIAGLLNGIAQVFGIY
jgi:hypothetical protein